MKIEACIRCGNLFCKAIKLFNTYIQARRFLEEGADLRELEGQAARAHDFCTDNAVARYQDDLRRSKCQKAI